MALAVQHAPLSDRSRAVAMVVLAVEEVVVESGVVVDLDDLFQPWLCLLRNKK